MTDPSAAASSFRRTKLAAIAAVGALAITFAATSGSAAQESGGVQPGQGVAIAYATNVEPRAGGLPLGIKTGTSLAGHTNSLAQASSQAIDLGVIGTTLAAQGCSGGAPTLASDKQPQALIVTSSDPGADKGVTAQESALPAPASQGFTKYALANGTPYGESRTDVAPFGIAGVLQVGGGFTTTHSGLVNGQREAVATSDISSITLAGQIQLGGLHWEVTYGSAPTVVKSSSFSIGSITIAGQAIPTQDPTAALAQLNTVLNPLGLNLTAPKARESSGILFVDPLGISVIPSPTRDLLFGQVLAGIQPVREQVFGALLKAYCSLSSEITVFDIAVGSISGAGSFNLFLGGVQATSGEVAQNQFKLGGFGGGLQSNPQANPSASLGGSSSAGSLGGASRPATTPTTTSAAAPSSGNQQAGAQTPAAATKLKGKRGGALAGVGLAGLLLLAAAAEGDRRKMRRAQREIPLFEE